MSLDSHLARALSSYYASGLWADEVHLLTAQDCDEDGDGQCCVLVSVVRGVQCGIGNLPICRQRCGCFIDLLPLQIF